MHNTQMKWMKLFNLSNPSSRTGPKDLLSLLQKNEYQNQKNKVSTDCCAAGA
jgi:hypothetical protein